MSDLISRQAAIDVIDSFNVFESRSDQIKLEQMIGELPPASNSEIPNSSDTISRAKAIDALKNDMASLDHIIKGMSANDVRLDAYVSQRNQVNYDIYTINNLPPAQPDIIRCKDCKHWIPYDWMFSEVWQSKNMADYPEDEIGCNYCDVAMKANDFCSRAERREVTT